MSYDKHHADLHVALKEFERLTGTGNVKSANSASGGRIEQDKGPHVGRFEEAIRVSKVGLRNWPGRLGRQGSFLRNCTA